MTIDEYLDRMLYRLWSVYTGERGHEKYEFRKTKEHHELFTDMFGDDVKRKWYYKSSGTNHITSYSGEKIDIIVKGLKPDILSGDDCSLYSYITEDPVLEILKYDSVLHGLTAVHKYENSVDLSAAVNIDGELSRIRITVPLSLVLRCKCTSFVHNWLADMDMAMSDISFWNNNKHSRLWDVTLDVTNNLGYYDIFNTKAHKSMCMLRVAKEISGIRTPIVDNLNDYNNRVALTTSDYRDDDWFEFDKMYSDSIRRCVYDGLFDSLEWCYVVDAIRSISEDMIVYKNIENKDVFIDEFIKWFTKANCVRHLNRLLRLAGISDETYDNLVNGPNGKLVGRRLLHIEE